VKEKAPWQNIATLLLLSVEDQNVGFWDSGATTARSMPPRNQNGRELLILISQLITSRTLGVWLRTLRKNSRVGRKNSQLRVRINQKIQTVQSLVSRLIIRALGKLSIRRLGIPNLNLSFNDISDEAVMVLDIHVSLINANQSRVMI